MTLVTIIGRGHSGTRAISHTLYASGVYMGSMLNASGDLVPPQQMYEACRVMARYVRWQGGLEWDFSALFDMDVPQEFSDLIEGYLKSVLESDSALQGLENPGDDAGLPLDFAHVPGGALHLLDSQPA